jgi:hypothetical protein
MAFQKNWAFQKNCALGSDSGTVRGVGGLTTAGFLNKHSSAGMKNGGLRWSLSSGGALRRPVGLIRPTG